MTSQQKKQLFGQHWSQAKKRLFKKIPKLLNNKKLAKRQAKPDPIETCISQSSDPEKCKDIH